LAAIRKDYLLAEKRFLKAVQLGLSERKNFEEELVLEAFRKTDVYKKLGKQLK
jgi:hypothetical protein